MGLRETAKNFVYDFIHLDGKAISEREARRAEKLKPISRRNPHIDSALEQTPNIQTEPSTWDPSDITSGANPLNPGSEIHDILIGPFPKTD